MKIAIAGGPGTGKTTLSREFLAKGYEVMHTDDAMDLGWSESSEHASYWFDKPGDLCIEGVAVPRALRKWLERHESGRPCDVLVFLTEYQTEVTSRQHGMSKGVMTVYREIEEELRSRGVKIDER